MIKVVTSWQILFSLAKEVGRARQALIFAEQLCEDTDDPKNSFAYNMGH